MNKISKSARALAASALLAFAGAALPGQIVGVKVEPATARVGDQVKVTVEGEDESICGLRVEYGNGDVDVTKMRAGRDDFPRSFMKSYNQPGTYILIAKGGRDGTAFGCMGEVKTTVTILEAPKPAIALVASPEAAPTLAPSGAAQAIQRASPPQTTVNSGFNGDINGLTYSTRPGKSLYFSGNVQGKPVRLIRAGALGSGTWTIYSGTPLNRVRMTVDDMAGVKEIFAVDRGQRIAVSAVGTERVEYRFYAPDRRFISGSVIYRSGSRWLRGLMKSEAFPGYAALTHITDVTSDVALQSVAQPTYLAQWIKHVWPRLGLISSAQAQNEDDLLAEYMGSAAQDRWFDRLRRMPTIGNLRKTVLGGLLVILKYNPAEGAALTTALADGAGVVLVAAADVVPFIAAVNVAVYALEKAQELKDMAAARRVRSDDYAEMTRATQFSDNYRLEPQPVNAEKKENKDLARALERVAGCTQRDDIPCAKEAVNDAWRAAAGTQEKRLAFDAEKRVERRQAELLAAQTVRELTSKAERPEQRPGPSKATAATKATSLKDERWRWQRFDNDDGKPPYQSDSDMRSGDAIERSQAEVEKLLVGAPGWKLTGFSDCGACEVGSTITIDIYFKAFNSINSKSVYTRLK